MIAARLKAKFYPQRLLGVALDSGDAAHERLRA